MSCQYLTHHYAICHHFILSYVAVLRPCHLSEIYPNRAYTAILLTSQGVLQRVRNQVLFIILPLYLHCHSLIFVWFVPTFICFMLLF